MNYSACVSWKTKSRSIGQMKDLFWWEDVATCVASLRLNMYDLSLLIPTSINIKRYSSLSEFQLNTLKPVWDHCIILKKNQKFLPPHLLHRFVVVWHTANINMASESTLIEYYVRSDWFGRKKFENHYHSSIRRKVCELLLVANCNYILSIAYKTQYGQ